MFQEDDPAARGARKISEEFLSRTEPIGIMQYRVACGGDCIWIYRDRNGQLWSESGHDVKLPSGYMQTP